MPVPTLKVTVRQCSTKHSRCSLKCRVHLTVKDGGIEYVLTSKPFTKWIDADMTMHHLRKVVTRAAN